MSKIDIIKKFYELKKLVTVLKVSPQTPAEMINTKAGKACPLPRPPTKSHLP